MNTDRLLAKSIGWDGRWHESMLLPVHLADAHRAACVIVDATGREQLGALGLSEEKYFDRFRRIVLLAAALHDLGKANDHFQTMIGLKSASPQAIRHEWITVIMLAQPGWRQWISPALSDPSDFDLLQWCVASHHLKLADNCMREGAGPRIRLLQDHADFNMALRLIADRLELKAPPSTGAREVRANDVLQTFSALRARWLEKDDRIKRLLGAAKATVIAADVGASALPVKDVPLTWIGERLSIAPTNEEFTQLVNDRLDGKCMRPFQQSGGETTSRVTFVKAGCGSGKTLLAYHWAANRSPVRRLYMCYPTTGTATEGFRDYLFDEEAKEAKFGAKLFHSRAEVDVERILHVHPDDDDEDAKLASLDAWSTPIVAATVDTVLGLIQSQRRAMYGWPALARSAFCFDEIHSYDNRMFGKLLRFLKELPGLPVLLMTASLPDPKLQAIKEVLAKQNDSLCEVSGPSELENTIRYHRVHATDVDRAMREHLAKGGKVLWVCNTVGRAMTVFDRLNDQNPLLYHSRYRYWNRVDRHRDVIAAFNPKQNAGPALAIATQVAEMSLDLSATLLVTDFAPIPALIQRLGRLNRRAEPGGTVTMPFIIIPPEDDSAVNLLPYKTDPDSYGDWPTTTRQWLKRLGDGPLSQRMLADAWDSSLDPAGRFDISSTWLDQRTSQPDSVREDSIGISVLLQRDQTAAAANRNRMVESVIPMNQPKRKDWKTWPRVKGVPVAPENAIEYDDQRGAAWKE